jgi:hypothetical protein
MVGAQLADILDRRPDVGVVGGSEPKYTDRLRALGGNLEPGVVECDWAPTISVARRSDLATCSLLMNFIGWGWKTKIGRSRSVARG